MNIQIELVDINNCTLHSEYLNFISGVSNTYTFTFSLIDNKISWKVLSSYSKEVRTGEYIPQNAKIEKVRSRAFWEPFSLNNNETYTYTTKSGTTINFYKVILMIVPEPSFKSAEEKLTHELQNIVDSVKLKFNYTEKIKGEELQNKILYGVDMLQYVLNNSGTFSYAFYEYLGEDTSFCSALDLSNFEIASYAFANAANIKQIKLDTRSFTNLSAIFNGCNSLEKIDITTWNPKNSSSDYYKNAFASCYNLKQLIIRDLKQTYCTSDCFSNCYHMLGTTNSTYNPSGYKDGFLYIRKDQHNLITSTGYTSTNYFINLNIKYIFMTEVLGKGEIKESYQNGETILTATPANGVIFSGWYNGSIQHRFKWNEGSIEDIEITPVEGKPYGFDLLENGFYASNNKGKASTTAYGRFYFTVTDTKKVKDISYISYGELNYDYGKASLYTSSGSLITSLTNLGSSPELKTLPDTFTNLQNGSYYLEVSYVKDGSGDKYNDTLQIKFEMGEGIVDDYIEGELISTDPVINIGVVDEQTMDPVNIIAKFDTV